MNIVAILANGVGSRFGSNIPKQFHKINGKMVIEYVIESIVCSKNTDKLIIATNVDANSTYLADVSSKFNIDLIDGGDTRNKTLKNVIDYIGAEYKECNKLIVCDAVRPLITSDLIDEYFDFLDDNAAVVTAQKITDSLGCYNLHQVNREDYYLMQSPEAFQFSILEKYFDEDSKLTEVTQQFPAESKIKLYFDFQNNFKLTYPADLKYLEALIKDRDNEIDFSEILINVTRLKSYLDINYPNMTEQWLNTLKEKFPVLLKKWQIEDYCVIKTSHFGIIFLAKSIKYGECVLKIIPPFIDRYEGERSCYRKINSSYMCELYDFDDECCTLLLERCDDADIDFNQNGEKAVEFFKTVIESRETSYNCNDFKDYRAILEHKLLETDFEYKNDVIMSFVKSAVDEYQSEFENDKVSLIHGDMHRYNIMSKNGKLLAIDPIGYIAPKEFDIARYIGTELADGASDIKNEYDALINSFSAIADKEKIKSAVFIDMVFRLHNSLFENTNYELTDRWLEILGKIAD